MSNTSLNTNHKAKVAINNFVREIIRECGSKGVKVYKNYATYFVKLLILDPNWGITTDGLTDRNTVHRFVTHCSDQLIQQHHPKMMALKIQMYFNGNFKPFTSGLERSKIKLRQKLSNLEKEIITFQCDDPNEGLTRDEYADFMKKVVYYCCLFSGLGDPTNDVEFQETQCALKSVFFSDDVRYYFLQSEESREDTLLALTDLTTGIRLFNKDCEKGGRNIENLPKVVNTAIDITKKEIDTSLSYIVNRVNSLTTIINLCYETVFDGDQYKTILDPSYDNPSDLDFTKDFLIFFRQSELYARQLFRELEKIDKKFNTVIEVYLNILKKIQKIVKFRTIVLTSLVYPEFTDLAHTWYEMQGLAIHLAQINKMMFDLSRFEEVTAFDKQRMSTILKSNTVITDAERLAEVEGETILDLAVTPLVTFLDANEIENFETIKLEYLGFCAWKLVETGGGLIPGNKKLGIARYDDKYFCFSSREAALGFCQDPENNVNRALHLGRQKPELINFLQILEQLIEVSDIYTLVKKIVKRKDIYEKITQTDLHLEEITSGRFYRNDKYYWNVWDWKRHALIMANISTKVTQSTQTIKSNAFSSIRVNTHELQDKSYQTKRDNYSNVPKPSTFIFGLRGRKDNNQHIINLTRPVDDEDEKLYNIIEKKLT